MPGWFSKKEASIKRPYCCAVVLAAGGSTRMGTDKMNIRIGKMTVIAHALTALERCECIDEIIVVTRQENIIDTAKLCRDYGIIKATRVVAGGQTRSESALIGISQVNSDTKLIAIHDGARPLVTEAVVCEAVSCAQRHLAAAPAIPVVDTIKLTENGIVQSTPPRDNLMAVQTPQVFEADLIKAALSAAYEKEQEFSDDCAAVEAFGVKPRLTRGSEENIKITTPLDILIAQAVMNTRNGE